MREPRTITVDRDVPVPTRDGVLLATDVYRPAGTDRHPVVLIRTPYGKDGVLRSGPGVPFDVVRAVEAGFVVVVQDVRGRFGSQGSFVPHFQEADDGVDVIAWAAEQSWSTGAVGMVGGSYVGGTQLAPARHRPPALRAVVPGVTPSDLYEGCAYQGGAHVLHGLQWAVGIAAQELARQGRAAELPAVQDVLRHLPLGDDPVLHEFAPFHRQWLDHPESGEFWEPASPSAAYDRIDTPGLHVTGWYDIFLGPVIQNYQGLAGRSEQQLVIGPWTHSEFTGRFPERDFGPGAGADAVGLEGRTLEFLRRHLTGAGGPGDPDPVRFFVMGVDEWRTAPSWPPPGTRTVEFFLRSAGVLSTERPNDEPADAFTVDPLDPVPTVGGQIIATTPWGAGPRDQRAVEERSDVLVFTSDALTEPLEVVGPVELVVHLSCSGRDTDVTGKLVDVHPDGHAQILTEGIVRARYRNSTATPELLEPGRVEEFRIDLWATANVFLRGHRIRLEVAGGSFPRWGRNSGTGGGIVDEGPEDHRAVVNHVHHDAARPSRLLLPVSSAGRS